MGSSNAVLSDAIYSGASRNAQPAPLTRTAPLLSVVVPTFNERANVKELISRLDIVLGDIAWEIVFVDDNSPDATHALVKSIARKDPRVRCLRRVGRRGLAGACIEGILSSSAPYVVVMDGDLQHDEAILPAMLETLRADEHDLVVGSRLVDGGSADEGFNPVRAAISHWSGALARGILNTDVRDVMSGFFMLRRDIIEELAPHLSAEGFKILADILATSSKTMAESPIRVTEVAYQFRERHAGESKLDAKVALDFVGLMVNKATRGLLPIGFVSFALVGALGLGVHMLILKGLMDIAVPFASAQMAATAVAIAFNFVLNNIATYRDRTLKGLKILGGLAMFYGVCTIGALSNIALANFLFEQGASWWLAAICGVVIGSVWNYALSSLMIWKKT